MSQDPLIGRVLLGQYTIEKRLGAGGFSTIYVADQPSLGRKVAIKTIHPHLATNPDTVTRFHREGLAISRLRHPAIVEIFNLGQESDGLVWIAMEYLEGESLASHLSKQGKIPAQALVEMLKPVCEVLSEAHEQGIIHRDLKPENIMLMAYRGGFLPKVLDFGMASLQEGSSQSSAMVGGTFAYMPPEQWQGLKYTDARSDIYAMGVIAYQCLAGRLPISADEGAFLAWAQKHLNEPPSPLVEAPPQVADVIYKSLQKEQANRQQDIMQFWSELSQAAQSQVAPVMATAQLGPPPQLRPQTPQAPSATMHLGPPPGMAPQAPQTPITGTAQLGAPPQLKPQAPVMGTMQLGAPPQLKPQAPAPVAPPQAKPLMGAPIPNAPTTPQAKPLMGSPVPSTPAPQPPATQMPPGAFPQAPGAKPNFNIPKSSFDIPKSSFDQPASPIPSSPIPASPIPASPIPASPIPASPIPPSAPKAQTPAPGVAPKAPGAVQPAPKTSTPMPQAPKTTPQAPRAQAQETKGGILQKTSNKPNPAASDMVDPTSLRDTLNRIVSNKKTIADSADDDDEEEDDEDWEPCFTYGFIAPDGTLQMAYYESESPFDLEFEDQEIKVQSDFAPAFVYDSYGDLYCALTAKNGKIYAGTFDDDGYLQLQHIGGEARSNAAPSIVCWGGDICIAIKGTDGHVYLGHAEDIEDIEFNIVDENSTTATSPSLATCDDTLYIAITGNDNLVYITYGNDPDEFGFQWVSDQFQTKQAPSIVYVENQLFFGLVGNDNKPYLAVMDDDDAIEPWEIGDGYKTRLAVSLSVWDGTLFYAMTSTTNKMCLALASTKERRPGKQLRFYEVGNGVTSKFSPGSASEPPPDYEEE